MSVSQQTRLIKKQYYTDGEHLFYVVDLLPDRDFVLMENCASNKSGWVPMDAIPLWEYEHIGLTVVE